MREIPVDVKTARAIFIEKLVTIIIDSFRVDLIQFSVRCARFFLFHQPRVFPINDPFSFLILDSHQSDHPIAVEVIWPVLIQQPVIIFVTGL